MALERAGVPAVLVAVRTLATTTGRGMAVAQGVPDFPIAVVEDSGPTISAGSAEWEAQVGVAAEQVERILLSRDAARPG